MYANVHEKLVCRLKIEYINIKKQYAGRPFTSLAACDATASCRSWLESGACTYKMPHSFLQQNALLPFSKCKLQITRQKLSETNLSKRRWYTLPDKIAAILASDADASGKLDITARCRSPLMHTQWAMIASGGGLVLDKNKLLGYTNRKAF